MSFNTKNYQETCDKLVIGGTLEVAQGATVTGLPAATATAAGVVKAAANKASVEGEELVDLILDFNDLLDKLKAAGIMVPDAP